MKRPAIWCAAIAVIALFACSSGDGNNGGFPFSGPSCPPSAQAQLNGCFGCYEQNCNGSCLTTACAALFTCICGCGEGDSNCYNGCIPQGETQDCLQCVQNINTASCQQACGSQCGGGTTIGGSSGGSSSSGGSGGGQVCNTSNAACPTTYCYTQTNGSCISAYYQVGSQIFPCASCTDTQLCLQEANDACMDAGPVADVGPGPDVGPPDVVPADEGPPDSPAIDASGATCHSVQCGTMGQSMDYCEVDDDAGVCTQAWYQVGAQVFDCTSCSASGCMSAEQAASMACP